MFQDHQSFAFGGAMDPAPDARSIGAVLSSLPALSALRAKMAEELRSAAPRRALARR